jgi:hypothetical protein
MAREQAELERYLAATQSWLPGMLLSCGLRVDPDDMSLDDWNSLDRGDWGELDMLDSATRGCMLDLLREVRKDPNLVVFRAPGGWAIGSRWPVEGPVMGDTEGEALANAFLQSVTLELIV